MAFNKKPILIERYEWNEKCSIDEIISQALEIANNKNIGVNFEHRCVEMTVYSDKTKRIPKADNTVEHYLAVYKKRLEKIAEK